MIDRSFLEKVEEMAKVEQFEILGRQFASKQLHLIKPAKVEAVAIDTLQGLVDFLSANKDGIDLSKATVHVESHLKVSVFGVPDLVYRDRERFAVASYSPREYRYGQYVTIEDFLVGLQTYFVVDDTVREILRVLGNVTDENVRTVSDDGITQQVTARTGITLRADIKIPNPVVLAPHCTFREVEQPGRQFILRLKRQEGQLPMCALFDADGGKWELEAMSRIQTWLDERLPNMTVIA